MSATPARRITPPVWTQDPAIRAVCEALGQTRFVGGAVRDTLLDRPIGDIDMATPLPPDEVISRLKHAGIKVVPTGIEHGTVTAIANRRPIEVTTLRRDVTTDGRHAVVAYTEDWAEDAARRDFTMNALYLDAAGGLWDPVKGLDDCLTGRVRFVGEAARRIEEDRLRLLRFYRFQAHFGRTPADPASRAACREAAPTLARLSGERIRNELTKLLAAPDPLPVLRLTVEDGVLAEILPPPADLRRLERLIALDPDADPLLRLGALLRVDDPAAVAGGLKLANRDRDRLIAMAGPAIDLNADASIQRGLLHRLGRSRFLDRMKLTAAGNGHSEAVPALTALANAWTDAVLPVGGADVMALGTPSGPHIGDLLRRLEAWWISEDFRPDREALLDRLRILAGHDRAAREE